MLWDSWAISFLFFFALLSRRVEKFAGFFFCSHRQQLRHALTWVNRIVLENMVGAEFQVSKNYDAAFSNEIIQSESFVAGAVNLFDFRSTRVHWLSSTSAV